MAGDAGRYTGRGSGPRLITALGDLALPDTGIILPRGTSSGMTRQQSDPQRDSVQVEDVVEVMQTERETARAGGVGVLVDAGSPTLGRRADIIVAVSRAAGLPGGRADRLPSQPADISTGAGRE